MTSIHPSEDPQWGWLVPTLNCADLGVTLAFYEKLGFVRFGGNPDRDEGWAMIRNGLIEVHLFTAAHCPADGLNFRGGDAGGIRAALAARGLTATRVDGPTSFTHTDPDGRGVFFDIGEPEVSQFQGGQPLTLPLPDGVDLEDRELDLGNFTWCLVCENLQATADFYCAMGFTAAGGEPENGWAILARADHLPSPGKRLGAMHLSLFHDMIPKDMLNFRGGNVAAIAKVLGERGVDLCDEVKTGEDGTESLSITDPDGRPVFFDTTPAERLYAAESA
jgi:catechol 2,3-dioxygenase-like lactoylglutathione lyase family enzyme